MTRPHKQTDVTGRRNMLSYIAQRGHLGASFKAMRKALPHGERTLRRWRDELAAEGAIEPAPDQVDDVQRWRLALPAIANTVAAATLADLKQRRSVLERELADIDDSIPNWTELELDMLAHGVSRGLGNVSPLANEGGEP